MKVLIVSDKDVDKSAGGAEMVVATTASKLGQMGIEVKVLTASILPDHSERLRNWRMIYNRTGLKLLATCLREYKPDVVHFHNIHNKFSFASLKVAKIHGAKVLLTAHDTYLFYPGKYYGNTSFWDQLKIQRLRFNPFRGMLVKRYLMYCDQVIAVSDSLRKELSKQGIDSITLHNGVDLSRFIFSKEVRSEGRRLLGLGAGPVVLWAGRLSVPKGRGVLPKIMDIVRTEVPDVTLLEIGGKLRLKFEEMPLAYAAADVVVTPSVYFDPFNLTNIEAGAMARPVVGTNLGGTPEIVLDGITGYIVSPLDIEHYAGRIIELLLNEKLAGKMGEEAKSRVHDFFDINIHTKRLLELYRS